MHNEGSSFEVCIELQDFSIVLQKLFLRVDLSSSQFLLKILLHLSILLGDPLVGLGLSPVVIGVGLGGTLRLSDFLVEFSGVLITVVEVDGPTIDLEDFSEFDVVGSHELAVSLGVFLPFQEFPLRNSRVLVFFLVDGDGVVFEVQEELDLAVAGVLGTAFDDTLLEVAEEAKNMAIEMNPVGLVELRAVLGNVLGIEVGVCGGDHGGVLDHWFLEGLFPGQGVSAGLLLVDVPVVVLLDVAHLLVVLLELLRRRKARQQREVGSHRYCNLRY